VSTNRDTFLALENELNTEVFERHDEVRGVLLATLTNKNVFLLGEPGTAKSFLLDRFVARIGGLGDDGYFKYLLGKFTNDAELFGPFSLKGLQEDRFKRITDGRAPKAFFIFYDEVYKGGSSILNTNLTLLNEHEFINDDDDRNIPLITAMGASNELPTSTELAAFADRFHLWYHVSPLRETSNLVKMMSMEVESDPEQILGLDTIHAAQSEVNAIEFPDDLFEAVLELKDHLQNENIAISDRRLRQSVHVAKAEAWMNGHSSVEIYDLKPLQFMFWRQVAEIPTVRNIVVGLTDPLERKAVDTLDNYNHAFAELEKVLVSSNDAHEKQSSGREALIKWYEAKKEMDAYKVEAEQIGRPVRTITALENRLNETIPVIVEDAMSLTLDKVDAILKRLG
jgi:MoxR-like ATPase